MIQAVAGDVFMRSADIVQVGLRPNPEFSVEVDDLDAQWRNNHITNPCYLTYSLAQLIETGGKRQARVLVADAARVVSIWDHEIAIQDLRHKVRTTFIDACAAQHKLALAAEHEKMAKKVLDTVSGKVKAGKLGSIQETKARVAHSSSKLAMIKALRALDTAKKQLIALLGCEELQFDCVDFPFYMLDRPVAFELLEKHLCCHPTLLKKDNEIETAYLNEELQRKQAIPDVTVEGGVSHTQSFNNMEFYFDVSIPLPFFDRNQGNIAKAYYQIQQIENQRDQISLDLESQLDIAYQDMVNAYDDAEVYKDQVLKEAVQAFNEIQEVFQQGKEDYLEVLDTQRSVFEAQEKYVDILQEYHKKQAEVEYIIGCEV
jgi:cobalt-zinc-cadmium efflux system outer membrane protein